MNLFKKFHLPSIINPFNLIKPNYFIDKVLRETNIEKYMLLRQSKLPKQSVKTASPHKALSKKAINR